MEMFTLNDSLEVAGSTMSALSGENVEATRTTDLRSTPSNLSNFTFCMDHYDPDAEFFEFITNGVLLNLVAVFGIFGNVISMVILSRPQMRSSINYLLIWLARCDTVLILTSVLLFGIPAIYPYTGYFGYYYYYIYPHIALVLFPLAVMAQTVSVYLTLTVTLERFVAVCHPLRARSLCTYGRARAYVIGIIIFSVVYNLPRFWEISQQAMFDEHLNTTVYCLVASRLRSNPIYISIYIHWLYMVFIYFLPFTFLAFLNFAIYRQVRKANAERQRLSRLQQREIGLATMLMCVVMVFFVCNVLALIVNVMEAFYGVIIDELVKFSNLLVTINSSVNFIIYVIFGEKFKKLFLRLFCSHGLFSASGRDSPDIGTHDDSLVSNGDRHSVRLQRHNTAFSRNGVSIRINGNMLNGKERSRSVRGRPPRSSSCVYYPTSRDAKDTSLKPVPTAVTIVTTGSTTPDWDATRHTTNF